MEDLNERLAVCFEELNRRKIKTYMPLLAAFFPQKYTYAYHSQKARECFSIHRRGLTVTDNYKEIVEDLETVLKKSR